jgi:hypothetical protein
MHKNEKQLLQRRQSKRHEYGIWQKILTSYVYIQRYQKTDQYPANQYQMKLVSRM